MDVLKDPKKFQRLQKQIKAIRSAYGYDQEAPMGGGSPAFVLGMQNPKVTQAFGNYNPKVEKFSKGVNYGTDFSVPKNTPITLPTGQWKVVESFNKASTPGYIGNNTNRGYGNSVLVQNLQTGEKMRFSHLNKAAVGQGQIVQGGTMIGLSGSTGNSSGPHVDVEYYDNRGKIQNVLASRYSPFITGQSTITPTVTPTTNARPVAIAGRTDPTSLSPSFNTSNQMAKQALNPMENLGMVDNIQSFTATPMPEEGKSFLTYNPDKNTPQSSLDTTSVLPKPLFS